MDLSPGSRSSPRMVLAGETVAIRLWFINLGNYTPLHYARYCASCLLREIFSNLRPMQSTNFFRPTSSHHISACNRATHEWSSQVSRILWPSEPGIPSNAIFGFIHVSLPIRIHCSGDSNSAGPGSIGAKPGYLSLHRPE